MDVHEVGRDAVLIEVGDAREALSLAAHVRRGEVPVVDVVPGVCTVLLDGVHDRVALADLLARWAPGTEGFDGRLVELRTTYDGADLASVAEAWGTDVLDVVRRHQETEFVVAFCGFSPGFAYLSGLPDGLAVPRRTTPRTTVPPGSVALAGTWCGVYPTESPGGWQLIGHTTATLWDVTRPEPALLGPGTRVRFVAT
ncbi:MAG: allophanate hydrolase subunit 1 [Nocardioides sp.]